MDQMTEDELIKKINSLLVSELDSPDKVRQVVDVAMQELLITLKHQSNLLDDLELKITDHGLDDSRPGLRVDDQHGSSAYILFGSSDDPDKNVLLYRALLSLQFQERLLEASRKFEPADE